MHYSLEKSNFAQLYQLYMKKYIAMVLLSAGVLSSCGEYNKVLKSTDYEYKYEAAKSYFAKGQNSRAATILEELIPILKGTYTELARFHSGKALYLDTPEPRLDQSSTYKAIQELQMFLEYFPTSQRKDIAQSMIFELQDKLVEKEYLSSKLYYDLGSYSGNASYSSTGNNYLAAIVTAQNVLKEYPYTKMREELSILILRAKYHMAKESVLEKREDRMRETVDEYYAFKNEFPESKYMKEVEDIFKEVSKYISTDEE